MAIPFKFPDPNDRSFNEPRIIIGPEDILKLYNQEKHVEQERVTAPVREWFVGRAESFDWDTAEFTGNQCTLSVKGMKDFHKDEPLGTDL